MLIAMGIGSPADWAILFIVGLVILGPDKLPMTARQLGQTLREFRKIADDFMGQTAGIRRDLESVLPPVLRPEVGALRSEHSRLDARTRDAGTDSVVHVDVEPAEDLMAPVHEETRHPGAKGLTLSTLPRNSADSDLKS